MATNSVPGANPQNYDKLSIGCWAEHEDGSLILVEGLEDSRVIYSIFDVSKSPMMEYRDAMLVGDFEKAFSCNTQEVGKPYVAKDKRTVTKQLWTWHDKTAFPWDRVLEVQADGPRYPSANALISAAERISEDLKLRGQDVSIRGTGGTRAAKSLGDRIRGAMSALID